MRNPAISKQILDELDNLSLQEQVKALNFTKSLAGTMPVGVPGKNLLDSAGTISSEDAKIMLEAIKECRQVDLNEW